MVKAFLSARPRASLAACLAVALALAPVAQAQAPLPDLGDSSQLVLSPAQERKIGESVMRQIRASGAYMNDPEVNDYLNELGGRLVAVSNDARVDFEFFAVADNQINAFALPGGFIGVNTGLILLAQSESELASVLAHEITHVTQHHIARMIAQQPNSMLASLAAIAVAVLASRAGGSSGGQAASAAIATAQAMSIQSQLNFTRENEYEADRIGFQRLAAANFDVNSMATLMTRLQTANRFMETTAPSYLRSHPVTYERVAEAQARAQGYAYRQVTDSLDFHMIRALLRSYQGESRAAVVFFEEALAERKYNNEIAAQYGLVAALLRDQKYPQAKVALAKLEKLAPPHPMVEAIAGHVLMDSGDIGAAVKRFESALARYPNKMQLVYDYPEALLKARRPADAAVYTETQLQRFTENGPLHLIAAKAYAELNQQLKQHQHQGEYYVWQGNLKAAVTQFEMAVRANDSNFYDASVVETRLRNLRRDLAEQQRDAFGRNG